MKKLNLKSIFSAALVLMFAATTSFAATAQNDDEDIHIVKINDSNFDAEVLKSKQTVILDVSSTSCPPCLIMIPTMIDIAKNYKEIKVASLGIDEPNIENLKKTLPIQAFPTFFIVKDGKIVNMLVGAVKEDELLKAADVTPKAPAKTAPKKAKKNAKKDLSCSVSGQFNGLKNYITISFVFGDTQIDNVDIVTDVFIPPELESQREGIIAKFRSSGKGEVTPTWTGFKFHTANDSRFMKAMDMKRTSTYGEMKAGLELQGFTCK